MTPSFCASLVNQPFGDPGLYVEVRWSKRALLFDLGENDALGPTRLLRAGDIFVSHTHYWFRPIDQSRVRTGEEREAVWTTWSDQQRDG